ncbi:cell envelope integrity protein TolA [Saccharospirillum alexandrii]|uniref:cell envelope integrity protein TolA n=1 Tax=Saccharospirillum alexandrii TaxID=2448477 RepID=UPI000FD6E505|nr:cell envelope integrity protein TolA [Saccharospirillum alexandrii]
MKAEFDQWKSLAGPVSSALVLHAVIGFVLLAGFSFTTPTPDSFELPPAMQASLRVEPRQQAAPQPKPESAPRPEPEPEPAPEPEPQPEPEPAPEPQPEPAPEPEPEPAPEPEPQPELVPEPEPEPEPAPEPEPQPELAPEPEPQPAPQPEPATPEDAFSDLLAGLDEEDAVIEQQQEQAEQRRATEARVASVTEDYKGRIGQQVQRAWSRPMEIRVMDLRDRETVVRINLLPTGEMQGEPVIVSSSGIPSLDQSALRALQRIRRFEVPDDMQAFNQNFRSFTITFKPEDLM